MEIIGDVAAVLSPPRCAGAGYTAKLETKPCCIVAVCRRAWYWARAS